MNYFFLRIYLGVTLDGCYVILYGYGVKVNQQLRPWKRTTILKNPKIYMFEAVLSSDELKDIQSNLEKESFKLKINDKEHDIYSGLVRRPEIILAPREGYKQEAPSLINQVTQVISYWALDKEFIRGQFLGNNQSEVEVIQRMDKVLEALGDEVGLDFKGRASNRIGNVDFYSLDRTVDSDNFKIYVDKDKSLRIEKKKELDHILMVRCRLMNGKECILDQLRPFKDSTLVFEASEPISRMQIEMWNQLTHEICYMENVGIMRSVNIGIKLGGKGYTVEDSWTNKLKKSYSKGYQQISDEIENVKTFTPETSSVGVDKDPWLTASYSGDSIKQILGSSKPRGAFCKKEGKQGEIDSFKIIKGYINDSNVNKVIIVDPYFSVKAAEKFLTRIENRQVSVDIIMSFTGIDPDKNDGSKAEQDYLEKLKQYLTDKSKFYPYNLAIENIVCGNSSQAFHDRFILRFFKDGTSDGFLLSNSLNSAGQFYHFVIAPIEQPIVYELREYVRELMESKEYYRETVYPILQQSNPPQLDEFSHLKFLNFLVEESRNISEGEIFRKAQELNLVSQDSTINNVQFQDNEIVRQLIKSYMDKRADSLIRLAQWLYNSADIRVDEVSSIIKKSNIDIQTIVADIINIGKNAVDDSMKSEMINPNDEQDVIRQMLKNKAKLTNSIEFAQALFHNPPYITCGNQPFRKMLYELVLRLAPKELLNIIDGTRDELAFSCLVEYMFFRWNTQVYRRALSSQTPSIKELALVWAARIAAGKASNKDFSFKSENLVNGLVKVSSSNDSILQLALIVAELRHDIILRKENKQHLKEYYLNRLADLLTKYDVNASENGSLSFLTLLRGRLTSESTDDVLVLAQLVDEDNPELAKQLRYSLVDEFKQRITASDVHYFDSERVFTYNVAKSMVDLYKDDDLIVKTKEIVNWKDFAEFNTPFLKDRDYTKWNTAGIRSLWELQLTSYIISCCNDSQTKSTLATLVFNYFSHFVVDNISAWPDHRALMLEFIVSLFRWCNEEWLTPNEIDKLLERQSIPQWVRLLSTALIDHVYERDFGYLLDGSSDELAERTADNDLIRYTLAESIILRLIKETDPTMRQDIKKCLSSFLSTWLEHFPEHREYYSKLCETFKLETAELQTGFVFPLLQGALEMQKGERKCQ